jgi:hypothetical protein|tara:strand:+ start:217 stop:783 length:567 start_codon:yes stop_codon:yes gene_type:complete
MLFYFKNDFIDDIEKHSPQSNQNIIENNRRRKEQINFHSSIQPIVDELSHYKKYNPSSYKDGLKNIQLFSLLLSDLEKDKIYHWTQYFENAKYYLTKSVNNFQSIGISVPEENYNDILKYNDTKPSKIQSTLGDLCKQLYLHGNHLLMNISHKLNKKLEDNIDMYHGPIHDIIQIRESNSYPNDYDLF